ncbi:MAG: hypothetical protein VYB54_03570 [Pseudomonadota bacterium]|nr:hypothetical protein [Pseudomonadota bacterium]
MHVLREGTPGESGYKVAPAESFIWQQLKRNSRAGTDERTNGLSGSEERFFQFDRRHSEIEVYKGKEHIGTIDAVTGAWKPDGRVNERTRKHTRDEAPSTTGTMVV